MVGAATPLDSKGKQNQVHPREPALGSTSPAEAPSPRGKLPHLCLCDRTIRHSRRCELFLCEARSPFHAPYGPPLDAGRSTTRGTSTPTVMRSH
jgi:hypothetical protein